MGAFIIVFLISRLTRRFAGKDRRGSYVAFAITLVVTTTLASFGFSTDELSPLQTVPWAAITYGKFALALLVIDLHNARQIIADPSFEPTLGKKGFKFSAAWIVAALIIAIGAAVSFLLPNVSAFPTSVPSSAPVDSAKSRPLAVDSLGGSWIELSNADIHGRVMMPGASTREVQIIESPRGGEKFESVSYTSSLDQALFMVQCSRFPLSAIASSATIERVVEGSRDGMLKNSGTRMVSEAWRNELEWPTLDVVSQALDGSTTVEMHTRLILQGRRLCSLAVANGSRADIAHFFESFKLDPSEDAFKLPHRSLPR